MEAIGKHNDVRARLATLAQLRPILSQHIDPVLPDETLRKWFDDGKVPRFKSNPVARRGGGPVFYSVAGVEKFLQSRTTTK